MRVCTFRILLEQRAVIRLLTLKGLHAFAITAELKSVYGTGALAISTVKKWSKRFLEGRTVQCGGPRCGRSHTSDLAEAISSLLKERPYLSCEVLFGHFRIAKGTCLRILHDTLGMKKFQLRWVPHAMDTNQKTKRVTLSYGILRYYRVFVLVVSRRSSLEIAHGSFCTILPDSIWVSSQDEVPERVSQKN
jgi:hypothetical protein